MAIKFETKSKNGSNLACMRAISEVFASNKEWVILIQATCMK